jgi:alpha-tubulin suppressor-like RCC1 family protein
MLLLIIEKGIEKIDILKNSIQSNIDIVESNNLKEVDISVYDRIAFLYHQSFIFPFILDDSEKHDVYNNVYFSDEWIDYFKTHNQIIDLLSCNYTERVTDLLKEYTIQSTIYYSDDVTGNEPIGDWILEKGTGSEENVNINVRELYFNENIDEWDVYLVLSLSFLLLDVNGNVYGTGINFHGNLGVNVVRDYFTSPHRIDRYYDNVSHIDTNESASNSLFSVEFMSVGRNHCLFKHNTTKKIYSCGYGGNGELGYQNTNNSHKPRILGYFNDIDIIYFYAGVYNSFFVDSNHIVYACGLNEYSQLGLGNFDTKINIEIITNLNDKNIIRVNGGIKYTHFLSEEGKVYSCGKNDYGQLGLGHNNTIITPQQNINDFGNKKIKLIDSGEHTIFLDNNGKVYSCGLNNYGQLGLDHNNNENTPQQITSNNFGNKEIVYIACGRYHTIFLDNNGKIYSCGLNNYGQLGLGYTSESIPETTPKEVTYFKSDGRNINIVVISAGEYTSVFVDDNGYTYTCGRNSHGQLGINSTTNKNIPTLIPNYYTIDFDTYLGPVTNNNTIKNHTQVNIKSVNSYITPLITSYQLPESKDLSGEDLTGEDLTGLSVTDLSGVQTGQLANNPADDKLPTGYINANNWIVGPYVKLTDADLSGADLTGADLTGIDLNGVNLTNADLTGVDLTNIDLTGAIFSDNTILSDGTLYSDNDTNIDIIKQVTTRDVIEKLDNTTLETDTEISFNNIITDANLNTSDITISNEVVEEIVKKTKNVSLKSESKAKRTVLFSDKIQKLKTGNLTTTETKIEKLRIEKNRKDYYKKFAKKINESVRSYLKTNVNKTDTEVQDIKPVKSIRGKPSDFGKDDKFDDIDSETNTAITIVYFIPPDDTTEDISINLYDPELNTNGNVISSDIEINQTIYYNYENTESGVYDSIKITRISDISYTLYTSTYDTDTSTYTYRTEGIQLNSLNDSFYNFQVVSANKEYKITVGSTNAQITNIDLISDVCFRGDTNIETDQGVYNISELKTYKHTINGRKIQAITKTKYNTNKMVCIKKNAINDNVPSEDIYVSQKHSIYMDKKLIEARDLVKKYKNVKFVKYQGEYLYNIVFDYHGILKIHNMYFESLHPKNKVAQMYISSNKRRISNN